MKSGGIGRLSLEWCSDIVPSNPTGHVTKMAAKKRRPRQVWRGRDLFASMLSGKVHNALLEVCLTSAPFGVAVFDRDLIYLAASEAYAAGYQKTLSDLIGRRHYDVFPEIPDRWKEIHRRCLNGERAQGDVDRFVRADGSVQYVRWSIEPWFEAEDRVGGLILYSEDVTEREIRRQATETDARLFSAILQSVHGIALHVESRPTDCHAVRHVAMKHDAFADWSKADFMARRSFPLLADWIHPDDLSAVDDSARARRENGTGIYEYRLRTGSGSWIWVRDAGQVTRGADGSYVTIMILHDVTEEKERQERLASAERMLSLARLTTGIGHEMNQPLTGIRFAAEAAELMLTRERPDIGRAREKFQVIQNLVDRTTQIIKDMKSLSQGTSRISENVAVRDMAEMALEVMRERMHRGAITLTLDMPEDLPRVSVPVADYQHVLINLLANAIDAYEGATGATDPARRIEIIARARDDGPVVLAVRDHAGGIPLPMLPRIFDPFFTTKGPDRGTGLGLSISQSIVTRSGGLLQVRNHAAGAEFEIIFPSGQRGT
jgi:PAS domain S-box-containing protein